MRTNLTAFKWLAIVGALGLSACGPGRVIETNLESPADSGATKAPGASDLLHLDAGSSAPVDAGRSTGVDAGERPAVDAGEVSEPPVDAGASDPAPALDAGTPAPAPEVDAGTPVPPDLDAGSALPPPAVDAGATTASPSFGCWAWSKPDPAAVVRAGFDWFESGYPGTLSQSENQTLASAGTVPFAYINMSEVPADTYLQSQIGSFWSSIALCSNSSWNTTVVDVRDPRWQDWLIRRANQAYDLGNRGIKWDVAGVESLCNGWSGVGGSAPQDAVAAMASVLATLKAQHPDFKFILNQGFALAEQHPEVVDGLELENLINYADAHAPDAWANELIARVGSIHANSHMPILDLEYTDLFGCSDASCAYADQLYSQIVALDWVPYITVVDMNVQGRGLGITAPW